MNILKTWETFSAEWKKVRRDFSELRVHDFRVATRRLIAELELASAVGSDTEAAFRIRQFKKILRRFGPLRDVQVHLQMAARFGRTDRMKRFSLLLKERENDEIRSVRHGMQERKRKALRRRVRESDRIFQSVLPDLPLPALREAIMESVRLRFEALMAADAAYRRTRGAEEFHKVRVKFKRFRYAAEAAQPVLGIFTRKQFEELRKLQGVMGEIHDLDTFQAELLAWSGDPGKTMAAQIRRRYGARLKTFNADPDVFAGLFPRPKGEGST